MMSKQIKAMANKAGVQTKVKTHGSTVTVTFLSEPTDMLCAQIRALSTLKAHGDLMDDTRTYTGVGIQFAYNYTVPTATVAQFETIKNEFAEHGYHFKQAVRQRMGMKGLACLDLLSY